MLTRPSRSRVAIRYRMVVEKFHERADACNEVGSRSIYIAEVWTFGEYHDLMLHFDAGLNGANVVHLFVLVLEEQR